MSLRKNRVHTRAYHGNQHGWTCGECGKRSYPSRKAARQAAAALPPQEGSYPPRAYRCPDSDEWHIGHLPEAVIKGERSRAEVEKTMDERDRRRRERG